MKILYFILLAALLSSRIFSQDCELGQVRYEKTPCNAEKEFYVFLNFEHVNNSDCFTVKRSGQDYGSFSYDHLPIKIGPIIGDCETNYEFEIRDCIFEHCVTELSIGKVCCEQEECKLGEIKFEKSRCSVDSLMNIKFNFEHQNTSDSFRVIGNGQDFGTFSYTKLPINIGPLKADCDTTYKFLFQDKNHPDCARELTFEHLCCDSCDISDLKLERSDCNAENQFYVFLNFKYTGTSECFLVNSNGHQFGEFKYTQLPVILGPFKGDCTTNYSFRVLDCKDEHCNAEIELGKVCCEPPPDCKISDLKIERTDCNEKKEFYIYLKFNHKGTSDCFRVKGNGHNYGEFKYSQLPIKLGPFKGDCKTEYEFVVIDCKNERCGAEINLGKVCCEQSGECKISDLKIEHTDCNEEKEFYIYLNFNHQGTSECFRVKGNGHNYGEFRYSQLPIKLGPFKGDCTTEYEFVVIDCLNEHCGAEINLGKVCCEQSGECKISDLKIKRTDCNEEKEFYI
ncbi:MAG: hypothetical protein M3Q56_08040, partial [Bacteroidota bacterium]|nr:hypothetical protein [Bacteroidota bacterium]